MLDANKKGDLVRLYKESYDLLKTKARSNCIKLNELDWYFNPVSQQHLDRYKKIYALKDDIDIKSNNFLFLRFISSVFNSGYYNDMTNNPNKFQELAQSIYQFDIQSFISNYPNMDNYKNTLTEGNYKNLGALKTKRKEKLSKSVHTIAKHILKADFFNSNKTIKLKNPTDIHGMGFALYADAIKESNLDDIAKPDTHIVDVLNAVFNKKYDKGNLKKADHEEIQKIMKDIAKANGVSVYKVDKIFWLVCAKPGNDFYLHKTRSFKDILCTSF